MSDAVEREILNDLLEQGNERDTAVDAICATYTGQEHSAGLRLAMEHIAAQKSRKHRQPAVAQPVQESTPARAKRETKKKEATMNPEQAPRYCKCKPGCTEIAKSNASPYAKGHNPNLKKAKRGTRSRRSEPTPPRKTAAKPAGVVTICVTETNLNNFWSRLSLEEKAELYQRQLEGA